MGPTGRCHIRLARTAWGGKEALDTRWWSMVLDSGGKAYTIRNVPCGDSVTAADVPRIVRALESLQLASPQTMIAVDDAPAVNSNRYLLVEYVVRQRW